MIFFTKLISNYKFLIKLFFKLIENENKEFK